MTKLTGISGHVAIKKFCKLGYQAVRQKGSHVRLKHPEAFRYKPLTIPLKKELKLGLLHQLIKDAGITEKEFLEL